MEEEVGAVTPLSELLSARDGAAKPEPAPEAEKPSAAPPEAVSPPDPPAPKEPDHEPAMIPRQAYHEEKRKRQELEAKLAEFEKSKTDEPPKTPDVFDPEYGQHVERRLAEVDWQNRVRVSTAIQRLEAKDYDEIEKVYAEAAQAGKAPRIPFDHPEPARFAYEIGKQIQTAREVGGDLTAYRDKLRKEWEAEAEAKRAAALKAKEDSIMPTLAGERSATPDKGAEGWSPSDLGSLLKKKRA